MRLAAALALLCGSAACSQGDSDNVMAASANLLTPAQVDLALGAELPNNAGNAVESADEADATVSENAVEAADEEDALDESVPEENESEPSAANNGLEQ